jgi:hypothetical protein
MRWPPANCCSRATPHWNDRDIYKQSFERVLRDLTIKPTEQPA